MHPRREAARARMVVAPDTFQPLMSSLKLAQAALQPVPPQLFAQKTLEKSPTLETSHVPMAP